MTIPTMDACTDTIEIFAIVCNSLLIYSKKQLKRISRASESHFVIN